MNQESKGLHFPLLHRLGWSPRDAVGFLVACAATAGVLVNGLFLQPGPHPAPMVKSSLLPSGATGATTRVGTLSPRLRPAEPALPASPAAGVPKPAVSKSDAAPPARGPAETIADIQRELARRGFYDGTVDGRWGHRTELAIRAFERAAALKPSREPNEALLRAITRSNVKAKAASRPASPAAPRVELASERLVPPAPIPESSSKRVAAVQKALADFGYGQIAVTGVMNAETRSAIERFERDHKLPVTGQISERVTRELAASTNRSLEQ